MSKQPATPEPPVALAQAMARDEPALRIPIVEEAAHLGKREFDTGRGVRIRTTVSEHLQEVDVLLRQDQVEVERRPVGRMLAPDEAPATHYEGDTLVVPVLEEVLVLEKRMRIKEELRITRTHSERRHRQSVPLKSGQVVVERFDEHAGKDGETQHAGTAGTAGTART